MYLYMNNHVHSAPQSKKEESREQRRTTHYKTHNNLNSLFGEQPQWLRKINICSNLIGLNYICNNLNGLEIKKKNMYDRGFIHLKSVVRRYRDGDQAPHHHNTTLKYVITEPCSISRCKNHCHQPRGLVLMYTN